MRNIRVDLHASFNSNGIGGLSVIDPLLKHFGITGLLTTVTTTMTLRVDLRHVTPIIPRLRNTMNHVRHIPSGSNYFVISCTRAPSTLDRMLTDLGARYGNRL